MQFIISYNKYNYVTLHKKHTDTKMNLLFNTQGKDTNGTPVVRFCDMTKNTDTYFYCSPLPIHELTIDHNFLSKPHKHDFYEIIWIDNGQGTHNINHNEQKKISNTIFFLSPETIHSFVSTKNISGYYLAFTRNFLLQLPPKIRETTGTNIHCQINDCFSYKITHPEIIRRDFEMIKEEYQTFKTSESNNFYYTATLISLLLMDATRYGDLDRMEAFPLHDISYKKYKKYLALVDEYYRKEHHIKFYVEKLHISLSSLTASTKLYGQLPPARIINERIILEAKTMVLNSDKNIKEIATLLGFEDTSNFSKFFKRMTNQSIADYKIRSQINVS